jgi:hypothetical protein
MSIYTSEADQATFRLERGKVFHEIFLYAAGNKNADADGTLLTKYMSDIMIISKFFANGLPYSDAYDAKSRISGNAWQEGLVASNLGNALETLFAPSWHLGPLTVTAHLSRGNT